MRPRRAQLRAVESRTRTGEAIFCGYCGERASAAERERSRVCRHCEMGLLLATEAALAPRPADTFLVVDGDLRVRALSREAERAFAVTEREALTRHVSQLLEPADSVSPDRFGLLGALAEAARAGGAAMPAPIAVRRAGEYGVRYAARVGPCHPGPAALLVLDRL